MGSFDQFADTLEHRKAYYGEDQLALVDRIIATTQNHFSRIKDSEEPSYMAANLYAVMAHVYLVLEGLSGIKTEFSQSVHPRLEKLEGLLGQYVQDEKRYREISGEGLDFTPVEDLGSVHVPHWKGYKGLEDEKKAFAEYFSDVSSRVSSLMKEHTCIGEYLSQRKEKLWNIGYVMNRLKGFKTDGQKAVRRLETALQR